MRNQLSGYLKERKKFQEKIKSKVLRDDEEKNSKPPANGDSTGD